MITRASCYFLSLTAASALLLGCSKERPPEQVATVTRADQEAVTQPDFNSTLPQVGGPEGYTGSDSCRSCHEDQYNSWHRSYHRSMTQIASDQSVQADFNDVVLTTDTTRFRLTKKSGEYWVHMEPLVQPPEASGLPTGLDVRLGLVTGSHHMQVFWLPEGEGNIQLGFPFTWLIPEKRWVPRNSTFVRPPDLPHRSEGWNVVCSRCHTTAVEPRVNFAAHTVSTRVAELGISCEACHGPGQHHVERQKAASRGDKSIEPGEIIHPKKLSAERSAQVCGFCHSMKWIDKSTEWRQNGFRYRPGDDLEQTTPIIRPTKVDAIAGLKDYLARNPDILDEFFWKDGMIRVSGREFNGLIESPCYKGGKFACVSCHSLHESDPDDQLATKAKGNGACIQCHDRFKDSSALTAHTHHLENSSGSECYNCHMPHTSYGILKSIRSHQISSPRVSDEIATGRPNACNLCHLDKTLAWTQTNLVNWFNQPVQEIGTLEETVADIPRLALTGDAGQRVIAAWHMSWPPALAISGTNWGTIFLAQLLDDNYSAVRCVAERSLKRVTNLSVPNYDYTIDPRARQAAREQLWTGLGNEIRANALMTNESLLMKEGRVDRDQFDSLLRLQNNRVVRLRE